MIMLQCTCKHLAHSQGILYSLQMVMLSIRYTVKQFCSLQMIILSIRHSQAILYNQQMIMLSIWHTVKQFCSLQMIILSIRHTVKQFCTCTVYRWLCKALVTQLSNFVQTTDDYAKHWAHSQAILYRLQMIMLSIRHTVKQFCTVYRYLC